MSSERERLPRATQALEDDALTAAGLGDRLREAASRGHSGRDRSDLFRTALDSMADLVAIQRAIRDDSGTIVDFVIDYMNPVNIDVANRPREELIGGRLLELYPAIAPVFAEWVNVVETAQPFIVDELPYNDTIDGIEVCGYYTLRVSQFGDGVLVVSRDITAEVNSRRRIEDTNRKFEAAQALAQIGIWSFDVSTGRVRLTDELRRIFGLATNVDSYDRDQLLDNFFGPLERLRLKRAQDRAISERESFMHEATIERLDRERRVVLFHGTTEVDGDQVVELWGTAQDVTRQRQAERKLAETAAVLEREHATVDLLQRAILPELPTLESVSLDARYYPAEEGALVGGDWYDVYELPDGAIGLTIGDIAGHGIPAASTMAHTRHAIRAFSHEGHSPGETIRLVNDYLLDLIPDAFATCIHGRYDPTTRVFTWAHAGHPPAVLYTPQSTVLLEYRGCTPLGSFRQQNVTEHETELPIGSTLVLYTDGLIEEPGVSLGSNLEKLRAVVERSAQRGVDPSSLCDAVREEMLIKRSLRDDLCILVLATRP